MLRKNLIINFGKIGELAEGSVDYKEELLELKTSVSVFSSVVENNSGAAATEMNKKSPDIITYIDKFIEGLEKIDGVLKNYDSEMTAIISPLNNDADMRIATGEISKGMKQLYNDLSTLKSMTLTVTIPTITMDDNSSQGPLGTLNSSQYCMDTIKEIENIKAKQEVVAQTINSICGKYLEDIEKIAEKAEKFAQKDGEFENELEGLYKEYADIRWYNTIAFKVIATTVVVIASVVALAVGAPVVITAAATTTLISLAETAVFSLLSSIYGKEDIESVLANDLYIDAVSNVLTLGFGDKLKDTVKVGTDYISNPKVRKFITNHVDEVVNIPKNILKEAAEEEEIDISDIVINSFVDEKFDKGSEKVLEKIDAKDLKKFEKLKNPIKDGVNLIKDDLKDASEHYLGELKDQIKEGNVNVKEMEEYEDRYNKENKIDGVKNILDGVMDSDKKKDILKKVLKGR